MHLNGRTAFLISKPLQLLVSLLVARQIQRDQKPLFVVTNSFQGANGVVGRLLDIFSDEIDALFLETPQQAFNYFRKGRFDHVFIDSDVGLRKFMTLAGLKLRLPGTKFYVFEEGLGTYRDDLYSGPKSRIFPFLGIATHFGASWFTKHIFVFDPVEYKAKFPSAAKRVINLESSMQEFLQDNHETLKTLFDFSGIDRSHMQKQNLCQIYLASWRINETFLAHFQTLSGDLFVKAHPHSESDGFAEAVATIDPSVPAELAIAELLENYETVSVFHHNSSIRRYISSPRVTFHDAHVFE